MNSQARPFASRTKIPRFCLLVVAVGILPGTAVAERFDEDFSIWPIDLKLNGSVIIGGGGTLPADVNEIFVRCAGGQEANLVVLRFSLIGKSERHRTVNSDDVSSTALFDLDSTTSELPDEVLDELKAASGVWLAAEQNLTAEQMSAIFSASDLLRQTIRRGGVICASGPAGMILGKARCDCEPNPAASGLNLIPDTIIATDFGRETQRSRMVRVLESQPGNVGIGIDKDVAIVLTGRKIRVTGQGNATFLLAATEREPVKEKRVEQAPDRRASPYNYRVDLTAWRRMAIDRTLAPFPPLKPESPHVDNGTLVIVGGGGLPSGLMNRFVELAGGQDAKLVYVPCSEREEVSSHQEMAAKWKQMGVKSATFIHTKDRHRANTDDEFYAPLKDATGIWFGGGRQWNFSDSYYGTKTHELMKNVLSRGGVIGGSSAGASIQARYLARANPLANYDIMAPGYERGLGFISGVAIDQHFSQRGRQKDMTQLANRYPQLLGIGIDEGTAIIVQKSIAEVAGKGRVFFYDRNRPVITGEPDYVAFEAGSRFDLEKRREIRSAPEDH